MRARASVRVNRSIFRTYPAACWGRPTPGPSPLRFSAVETGAGPRDNRAPSELAASLAWREKRSFAKRECNASEAKERLFIPPQKVLPKFKGESKWFGKKQGRTLRYCRKLKRKWTWGPLRKKEMVNIKKEEAQNAERAALSARIKAPAMWLLTSSKTTCWSPSVYASATQCKAPLPNWILWHRFNMFGGFWQRIFSKREICVSLERSCKNKKVLFWLLLTSK